MYQSIFVDRKVIINFDEIYEKNEVNEDNDILFISPYLKVNGKNWDLLGNECVEKLVAEINKSGLYLTR